MRSSFSSGGKIKRIAWLLATIFGSAILPCASDKNNSMDMTGWICNTKCVDRSSGTATCNRTCSESSGAVVFIDNKGRTEAGGSNEERFPPERAGGARSAHFRESDVTCTACYCHRKSLCCGGELCRKKLSRSLRTPLFSAWRGGRVAEGGGLLTRSLAQQFSLRFRQVIDSA